VLPGLSFLLGDLGLARTTATSGTLLSSIDATATVLLAALFLRERVGAVVGAALVLGTAGTILVALDAPGGWAARGLGDARRPPGARLDARRCRLCRVVPPRGQPAEEGVGRTAWQFLGATLAVLPGRRRRAHPRLPGPPDAGRTRRVP
jgi:hypothetical protein